MTDVLGQAVDPHGPAAATDGLAPLAPASTIRRLGVGFWLAAGWSVLFVTVAVVGPLLPLPDPERIDTTRIGEKPSLDHWLGTDALGRDLLARLVHGARVSFVVGIVAIGAALLVGGALGMVAGYRRGAVGAVIVDLGDTLLAFPPLVLALAMTAFLGASLRNVTIAIGVLAVPPFLRLARTATIALVGSTYVRAARILGARDRRIVVRELLPNVIVPLTAFGLVAVGIAIVVEGALSYLGIGVPPPRPTWGGMIAQGRTDTARGYHIVLMPAATMFLTVLALNVVGDHLRRRYDVRESAA